MKLVKLIAIIAVVSSFVTFSGILFALNVPAYLFSFNHWFGGNKLGSEALTDITSTNLISDYPTTQNANNTIIENTTITVGTTSVDSITALDFLASVGTITSGTWNADAIAQLNGGSGTTTPGTGLIMVASSTAFDSFGYGSSGQIIQSQGHGLPPIWASLNSTSTSFIFNGLAYSFPVNHNASSSVLINDGTGGLHWGGNSFQPGNAVEDIGLFTTASADDVTDLRTIPIERNSLHMGGVLIVEMSATSTILNGGGAENTFYDVGVSLGGNSTTTCSYKTFQASDEPSATTSLRFVLRADTTTKQSNSCFISGTVSSSTAQSIDFTLDSNNSSVNLTNNQNLFISASTTAGPNPSPSLNFSVFGITAEIRNPR